MTLLNQEVGHTEGPWLSSGLAGHWNGPKGEFYSISFQRGTKEEGNRCSGHVAEVKVLNKTEEARAIARANASLIAEAGTIAHETGLTPRQLADELKKSNKGMSALADQVVKDTVENCDLKRELRSLTSQRNELLEALKKTKKFIAYCRQMDEQTLGNSQVHDATEVEKVVADLLAKAQQEGGQS